MTKDEVRGQVDKRLSEFLDGYIIVGKVAGQPFFVLSHQFPNEAARGAMLKTIFDVVQHMEQHIRSN